jgi:hypothetical protein
MEYKTHHGARRDEPAYRFVAARETRVDNGMAPLVAIFGFEVAKLCTTERLTGG